MKAPAFEYHHPATRSEALALMAGEDVSALAGGQSLMPMMNFRVASPETLIDLNGITDLDGIAVSDGRLMIGAMTRYAALEASEVIATHAPLICKALPHIAHPAIRNRGTIGGSCALADPAAEMPALLLALGADIHLQNATGARQIAADDFFVGVYETARQEDELVVGVELPIAPKIQRHGFHEITRRHGDYAMAGCAIVADTDQVRVALFGVSDCAVRAKAAEAVLAQGGGADTAAAALDDIEFLGDMNTDAATKRHLAGVALRRAWAEVSV